MAAGNRGLFVVIVSFALSYVILLTFHSLQFFHCFNDYLSAFYLLVRFP